MYFTAPIIPSMHPGATLQSDDVKREICFDFTKGTCMRGDACKFSHDVAYIAQVNSQERGICFDYLRGQCMRGPLCRFSHDITRILHEQELQRLQGIPQATQSDRPICYDFVKGQCERGARCQYSHNIFTLANSPRGGKNSSTQVCFDNLRGKCTRGKNCRYSHAKLPPNPLYAPGMPMLPGMVPMSQSIVPSVIALQPQVCGAVPAMGVQGAHGLPVHVHAMRMAHMAALQAANSVVAQTSDAQAAVLPAASVGALPPSQLPSRQNSTDNLVNSMLKLQLAQARQQCEVLAKKAAAGVHANPDDFDEAKIRAVWDQHTKSLPPVVTAHRSLPPSGACTPNVVTPRTPAIPLHNPFSRMEDHLSHAYQRSSLGLSAAQPSAPPGGLASDMCSQAGSMDMQIGSCVFAMPAPQHGPVPDYGYFSRAHSVLPPHQPGTAPASLAGSVAGTSLASDFDQPSASSNASQPSSARTDDMAGAFASAFPAFDRQLQGFSSAPASLPSLSAQTSSTQDQMQSYLDEIKRPSSAEVADSELFSRVQSIWQLGVV